MRDASTHKKGFRPSVRIFALCAVLSAGRLTTFREEEQAGESGTSTCFFFFVLFCRVQFSSSRLVGGSIAPLFLAMPTELCLQENVCLYGTALSKDSHCQISASNSLLLSLGYTRRQSKSGVV